MLNRFLEEPVRSGQPFKRSHIQNKSRYRVNIQLFHITWLACDFATLTDSYYYSVISNLQTCVCMAHELLVYKRGNENHELNMGIFSAADMCKKCGFDDKSI